MTEQTDRHGGHCLCRATRFAAQGAPDWVAHCHCESCRRATASPVTTFAGYKDAAVNWSGEAPRVFNSSPGVARGFCGRCGTPLFYRTERRPEDIDLYLSTFEDPTAFEPQFHVFAAEQLAWLRMGDGLPRYAGGGADSGEVD